MKLAELTIKEAHEAIKDKKISSIELTNEIINRIDEKESKIDAYITLTPDIALKKAKKVDKLISENQKISPLAGIPVSIKDVIITASLFLITR